MKSGSLKYLLKEGFRGMTTNKMMSFASVGVLSLCLIMMGLAFTFSMNVTKLVGDVESTNEIVIFMYDDTSEERMEEIGEYLENHEGVEDVVFISNEEALEIQKESMGSAGDLLDEYADASWFPNSYSISLTDISTLTEMVAEFETIEEVETVRAPEEFAEVLVNVKDIVTNIGIGIILILTLVALIIISNTVRITVFSRRHEVNIMKYVGATNTFIRIPFIVEGMIMGIVSALLAFLAIWGGYTVLDEWLASSGLISSSFGSTETLVPFVNVAPYLVVGFLAVGVVTGTIGCVISLRKHLKV